MTAQNETFMNAFFADFIQTPFLLYYYLHAISTTNLGNATRLNTPSTGLWLNMYLGAKLTKSRKDMKGHERTLK